MIGFSIREILLSVVYGVAYGMIFSAVASLCRLIASVLSAGGEIGKECISFNRIFPLPDYRRKIALHKNGRIFSFLSILFFSLGFILISYFSLDGEIRLYMLVVSSATLYLSNYIFYDIFGKLLVYLINRILQFLSLVFRLAISPVLLIIRYVKHKNVRN